MKTKHTRVPKKVVKQREDLGKVFNCSNTKSFLLFDKITCEIIKQKKRKGRMYLEIDFNVPK